MACPSAMSAPAGLPAVRRRSGGERSAIRWNPEAIRRPSGGHQEAIRRPSARLPRVSLEPVRSRRSSTICEARDRDRNLRRAWRWRVIGAISAPGRQGRECDRHHRNQCNLRQSTHSAHLEGEAELATVTIAISSTRSNQRNRRQSAHSAHLEGEAEVATVRVERLAHL